MKVNRQELFKIAGLLGGALLVAGYLRYSILEVLGTWEKVMLTAGGALLLATIAANYRVILGYFTTRQGKLGTNTAALTAAVIGLLVIGNYLGYRHHKRIDLTAEQLYSLSDQTKKVVAGLQKEVKILKFDQAEDVDLRDRMIEYKDLSRRLTYEWVDPQKNPEIAKQYGISRLGEVVVAAGERVERPQGASEQELTNAILKVTRDSLKKICFLEGHGERSITDNDSQGFSSVDRVLKNENYETATINLATSTETPSDCAVIVVAGPKQSLLPPEVAMIGKYLDAGGKAMFLLDPDTNPQLDEVLKAWNINLGNDIIIDASAANQMFGGGALNPLVFNYGAHPITRDFTRTMTVFPNARSVRVGEATGTGVTATTLLTTSESSWGETELKPNVAPKFDEGKDTKGPVTLGVAATKAVEGKEGRLVVIGDSDFASNRAFAFQRNGDLFMNAVNWLAEDEDLISIRPKSQANRRVDLTEGQRNMLFWLFVLVMPVAVIGAGAYVWWKRR
ncbi:MAG: GldG family protein [Acidobacteria bacterium]|nr:GldG family protein [Acidobacteriota bacterium]MCW5968047.1 GldG family protein [Blastocatellales bacterium]